MPIDSLRKERESLHRGFWKVCVDRLVIPKEEVSRIVVLGKAGKDLVVYTWSEAFYLALKHFSKPMPKKVKVSLDFPTKVLDLKELIKRASNELGINPRVRIKRFSRNGNSMKIVLELMNNDADEFLIFLVENLEVIQDGGVSCYSRNVDP